MGKPILIGLTHSKSHQNCGEIAIKATQKPSHTAGVDVETTVAMIHNEIVPEDNKIVEARRRCQDELLKSSATTMNELTPWKNFDQAFQITLVNPDQEPIACKSRPLPFHLKKKVKQALDDQEKAGIIRKSKSNWAFALRVVHKPDFIIRL